MISNFSSFVEFFAAIYVTMAVNNDFCSNYMTGKYTGLAFEVSRHDKCIKDLVNE